MDELVRLLTNKLQRWQKTIGERLAVKCGRIVNCAVGTLDEQGMSLTTPAISRPRRRTR